MSKRFYCFTRELNDLEKVELKKKGTIRSSISKLSNTCLGLYCTK